MTNWPRGGYPAGDTPASELKPPPESMISKSSLPATYTAAEVKVLTEAALRLGRKEMFDHLDVAFDRITYASDDGLEFEHTHPADEGEPECPACWAQHIRQIFAEFSPYAAPDATSGRTDPGMDSDLPQDSQAVRSPRGDDTP